MTSSARIAAITASAILVLSCERTATLRGGLVLKPGESGDVRGSRVLLYAGSDSAPEIVAEVLSEQASVPSRSPFVFQELKEGAYHILAWKDLDHDGSITDGDLAGVAGGHYDSASLGEEVGVLGGQDNDIGTIEMQPYRRLMVRSSGWRNESLTSTSFSYRFNRAVALTTLTIGFPRFGDYVDPAAPGLKEPGVQYQSEDWSFGSSMPEGRHVLGFRGVWDGKSFSVEVPVLVE